MSEDVIPELCDQLELIPDGSEGVDLLLVSNGGDPMVALRIVTVIREQVKKLAVLVPNAAYSAATLLALGADEIVMHPNGNLGPVDPQIVMRNQSGQETSYGFEDMHGFMEYVQKKVGLTDQEHIRAMLEMFCRQMSPAFVGKAARSSLLSFSMGENLLQTHMPVGDPQKPRRIIETLNKSFYDHGYPINREEARKNELPVANSAVDKAILEVEGLIWKIWRDVEDELECRKPFNPSFVLMQSSEGQKLLRSVPLLNLPADTPADAVNQIYQRLLDSSVDAVEPVDFRFSTVLVESLRLARRFEVNGKVIATRTPDLNIVTNVITIGEEWVNYPSPASKGEES